MARSYVFRLESKAPLHEVIRALEALGVVRSFREDTGSELQPVPKKAPAAVTKPRNPNRSEVQRLAQNSRAVLFRDKIFEVLGPIFEADHEAPTWKAVEALNKSNVKPWKGEHWTDKNVHQHIQYVLDRLTKPSVP